MSDPDDDPVTYQRVFQLAELARMDQLAEVGLKVVETLAGLLHALMKQITLVRYLCSPDAVFLERINDRADVLSVVVCIKLKGTENTVRRRTDAGEKYGCTFLRRGVAQVDGYLVVVVIPLVLKALPCWPLCRLHEFQRRRRWDGVHSLRCHN